MSKIIYVIVLMLLPILILAQTKHTIESGNYYYSPDSLTINVGDTIQWINVEGRHNVNANVNTLTGESFNNPESFESEPTREEVLLTRVFNIPGEYNYDCSVGDHAENGMVAYFAVVDNGTTTALKDQNNNPIEFKVIYNPREKVLNISYYLTRLQENLALQVSDISGKKLLIQNLTPNLGLNQTTLELTNITGSGIYLVSVRFGNNIITEKINVR